MFGSKKLAKAKPEQSLDTGDEDEGATTVIGGAQPAALEPAAKPARPAASTLTWPPVTLAGVGLCGLVADALLKDWRAALLLLLAVLCWAVAAHVLANYPWVWQRITQRREAPFKRYKGRVSGASLAPRSALWMPRELKLSYAYSIAESAHTGALLRNVETVPARFYSGFFAEEFMTSLKPGKSVRLWVSPDCPERPILELGSRFDQLLALGIFGLCVLAGVVCAVLSFERHFF